MSKLALSLYFSAVTLGQSIRTARKIKRWGQKELGKRVGAHYVTISEIERDQSVPRSQLLNAILRELEISYEEATKDDPRFQVKEIDLEPVRQLAEELDKEDVLKDVEGLWMAGDLTTDELLSRLELWRKIRKERGLE